VHWGVKLTPTRDLGVSAPTLFQLVGLAALPVMQAAENGGISAPGVQPQ
jgi:hypothetical protein